MGWNQVEWARPHALTAGIPSGERFYFVHSYVVQPEDPKTVVGIADYGQRFCVALGHDNLFAVQFHPEKSASAGLEILRNFVSWRP
jgi:Glutamine amidotransferase